MAGPAPRIEPRIPLSKERVLRAAVEFADAHGIEALSMRRLAKELGVEAMSLYNHVANKDEILSGIVEIVAGEVEVPSDPANWKTSIRQSAISAHDAFIRHRWSCSLMTSTPSVVPSRMRWMEGCSRRCAKRGSPPT